MTNTILLADDSVTIQKVIELTFMDEDYEVVSVGDGDEALDRLEEVTPDVVIADVHMPGASGYDVAKRSKQLHPQAPVLLLVGTFEPFDEGDYQGSGADACLKKPFDSQELLQRVSELLEARAGGPVEAVAAPGEPAAAPGGGETRAVPTPSALETEAAAWTPGPVLGSLPTAAEGAAGEGGERPAAERQPWEVQTGPWRPPGPTFGGLGDEMIAGERTPPPPGPEGDETAESETAATFGGETHAAATRGETAAGEPVDVADAAQTAEPVAAEGVSDDEESPWAGSWQPPGGSAEAAEESVERAEEPFPELTQPATAAAQVAAPAAASPAAGNGAGPLSDEDVDRVARRVAELLGDRVIRDVAWEVVPDLAEVVIKDRLRELESELD